MSTPDNIPGNEMLLADWMSSGNDANGGNNSFSHDCFSQVSDSFKLKKVHQSSKVFHSSVRKRKLVLQLSPLYYIL